MRICCLRVAMGFATEGHNMGVKDIVDLNVLVQGPCHELEQVVIGVSAAR